MCLSRSDHEVQLTVETARCVAKRMQIELLKNPKTNKIN